MEITNASIEDIDRIEEIATAAFKSTVYYAKPILTTHVEHFPQGFLLAREGKEILGFICGLGARETSIQGRMYEKKARPEENPTTFMGLYLAIDPKYQGKGIGTELLRQAEHLSATLGCTRLTLICEDHLIPLYKKLGYTLDGINALKYGNKTWYDMSIETKK